MHHATRTATDLADRFPANPLLRPDRVRPSMPGMQVECLLNPGVFRLPDGRIGLLLRVAERPVQQEGRISFPICTAEGTVRILTFDRSDPLLDAQDPRVIRYDGRQYLTTMSHFATVVSDDGVSFREDTTLPRIFGQGDQETYGIEDCRVARIGDRWWLTFTQVSEHGVGVGLRSTSDWRCFEHHGMILPAHNKDCALFEERIGGWHWALHRPSSPELGGNFIWLASSPDLVHWGFHRCIAHTRPGCWDAARIGAGASPIRTPHGWLCIYHGADASHRYCLGALLLDLEQPWRVIARSEAPIMESLAAYEREGFLGNVVFTNGHLVDGDTITLYYGASDTVVCGARLSIRRILASLGMAP